MVGTCAVRPERAAIAPGIRSGLRRTPDGPGRSPRRSVVELEHRFEVPVGVEKAWVTLLDIEQVGPCFPGAILEHGKADEFSGWVKIKFGPIKETYHGTAKIVEKDEKAYRARIEATGNAGGAASPAAMLVTL